VTDATPVVAKASDDDDATRWGPKWRVTTRSVEKGDDDDANAAVVETFDALVVCNGHYSVPRVPSLPGSEARPPRTDWSPYDRVRVVHAVP
jgi:cation diffusion facilitator CzcD-associated flavoprotein CzcO